MARILCGISGVEFTCSHMQFYSTSRESHHPIFDIPTSKLLEITPRWLEGELTHTENYLLYLALFNSTKLMDFRVPATFSSDTPAIVAQNMNHLANIVEIITRNTSAINAGRLHLPSFVITPDTKDLSSSPDWIKIWNNAYSDYQDGYRTSTLLERIERQETILERYIKDHSKDVSTYAAKLANWAHDAGSFEKYANFDIINEKHQSELLSDYWKRIIIACAKNESAWSIDEADLQELIEHCEDHINHGSIYAQSLMALLESGLQKKKSYLDLGDIDLSNNGAAPFRILDADASVEDANKLALIDSAPEHEPKESDYPNKLAFIRAKMKYRMAQEYKTQQQAANVMATSKVVLNRRAEDTNKDSKDIKQPEDKKDKGDNDDDACLV